LLNLSHLVFREGVRFLRRRGYNLRHVVVIGTAPEVKLLVAKLEWYRHLGLKVAAVYLIAPPSAEDLPGNPELVRNEAELRKFIGAGDIDQVFVTLPLQQAGGLPEIQSWLGDEPVTVHFVPDLALAKLRGSIEEFDGSSIMTLQSSPLTAGIRSSNASWTWFSVVLIIGSHRDAFYRAASNYLVGAGALPSRALASTGNASKCLSFAPWATMPSAAPAGGGATIPV
jgi:hypothetical protein